MIARRAVLLLALAAAPAARAAPGPADPATREAKARAYFTDTPLLTQDGKEVRFYSDVLRGNVVLLSFVFTRCVEACPLIMQKLNAVRRGLGDAFPRDARFVTLSVDPDFDTPAELTHFQAKQGAVHPGWTLLTGKKANITTVLTKLGEWSDEPGNHSTAFVAGNVRTGHWSKVRPDTPPAAIVELLQRLAAEDRPEPASAAR